MKILFTGDWHIGLTTHSKSGNRKSREEELRDAIRFIRDYSIREKIDVFINLGDMFHTNKPSIDDVSFAIDIVSEIEKSMNFFMIEGNHDIITSNEKDGPVELLKRISNGKIITDRIESFQIDDLNFVFVPFPEKLQDSKKFFLEGVRNIIIAHTSLEGATIGYESMLLAKICETEKPIDGCILISGHIHKYQVIRENPDDYCAYAGSVIVNDFGEIGQKKGFIVYDSELRRFEFIETPCRKFYDLKIEEFLKLHEEKSVSFDDCIVRIYIDLANKSRSNEIREICEKIGVFDLKIVVEEKTSSIVRDSSMKRDLSPKSLFDKFISYSKDFDENDVKNGYEILDGIGK